MQWLLPCPKTTTACTGVHLQYKRLDYGSTDTGMAARQVLNGSKAERYSVRSRGSLSLLKKSQRALNPEPEHVL